MKQERVQRERQAARRDTEEATDAPARKDAERSAPADLASEMDAILEDIDAVLEQNAEEFVNAYVQKGGE